VGPKPIKARQVMRCKSTKATRVGCRGWRGERYSSVSVPTECRGFFPLLQGPCKMTLAMSWDAMLADPRNEGLNEADDVANIMYLTLGQPELNNTRPQPCLARGYSNAHRCVVKIGQVLFEHLLPQLPRSLQFNALGLRLALPCHLRRCLPPSPPARA